MTNLKRFLTLFFVTILAVSVWGADITWTWTASSGALGTVKSYDASLTGSTSPSTPAENTKAWHVERSSVVYTGFSSSCIQFGSGSGAETVTLTSSAFSGTIKSVYVVCSSYNNAHQVAISVGGTTYLSATNTAKWTTVSSKGGTGTSSGDIQISFTPGSRALYIKSITVTYDKDGGSCSTDPTVGTIMNAVSDISATGATFSTSAGVTAGTGCSFSEVGFVYNTAGTPTTSDTKAVIDSYTSGNLNKSVSGLTPNTTYYVRAFATNGHGTSYSDEKSFKTDELTGEDFELVTDVSDLSEGDEIILLNTAGTYAMGAQSGNNCPAVASGITTWSISSSTVTVLSGVQIITLGKSNGNWTFNTGSGYLYAASSGSNYLKVQDPNDANGEWIISLNADDEATITAQGSNTHNLLRYNSGSTLFSCYASGQQLVKIYKKNSGPTISTSGTLSTFNYNLGEGPSAPQTFTVSGKNLTGNLTVTAPSNYQVSLNGTSWATSQTLTASAGTVSSTTIYVHLVGGLAVGTYNGNITISGGGATDKNVAINGSVTLDCSTPTISFTEASITKYQGDANFTITPNITGNSLSAAVTYSSDKTSCATVDENTGEVHIVNATGSGVAVRITATLAYKTDGSTCTDEVSAYYDLTIYNHVYWKVNGADYSTGSPTDHVTEGGKPTTLPTDPDGSSICGGKTFVGWTDAPYVENSTPPANLYKDLSDFPNITDNATYHAVFAEEIVSATSSIYDLVRNPSEFVSGEDYVIAAYSGGNDYALKAAMSGSYNLASQSVSIPTSNTFTCTEPLLIWQVTKKAENQYTLYNASAGKYAYMYTSGTYKNLGLQDGEYIWDLQYDKEDGYSPTYYFEAGNISDYYFYYNSSAFKTTSSIPTNIYFYKKATEYTYDAYSTTCGPVIKAYDVERLTSTKDQTVKSQAITIKGSNLTGGTLMVKSITGAGASYFACTIESNTISAGAINTTYTISYTPTVYGGIHEATLIFTDGTTDSDPITLRGRSLPQKFAIVAQEGANYYALDGSMSGEAAVVRPLPVTVTAGSVDLCPTQAVYSLTDLETPNQNVYLESATGRLYGAGSSTGLNTKSFTSTSGTGWLLSTEDFDTYHITNATTTNRGIMYNDSYDAFGHYSTGQYGSAHYYGDLRLLPITHECTCLANPNPVVVARATTATIYWEPILGADHYEVTCSGGSVTVVDNRATITGLTNNTAYTYTVQAVAAGYDCSLIFHGNFTTVDCDDVPYDVQVAPGVKTATIRWAMESATATVRIYSDEECNTQVAAYTGKTSPLRIEGLTEDTQYYLKIFAGPSETCASAVVPFLTQTTTIEIAEWATDHINVVLNDIDAHATALIEDKNDNITTTGSFAEDIFFSKYFEASGFTKLVGLYNGTDHDIDISDLIVKGGKDSWPTSKSANNYVVLEDVSKLVNDYGDGGGHIMLPKGTEIILYSIQKTNKAGFTGAGCIDEFYDWDDLANNTVENWYMIGAYETDTYDDDGHKTLNFPGSSSISLWRGSTMIDLIGAGNSSAPNSTACTTNTTAHTLGNGRTISCPNDKPGFFCETGMAPPSDEYPDGYSTYLTTNRCLLIRSNHVLKGDSAVLNNGSDFKTLGEYTGVDSKTHPAEWVGIPIGNDGTSAERDCLSGAQFGYVGDYDYNAYYAKYEEVVTVDELGGHRNEDGTYTIPIPQLDTLSCTMMRVKVYEGGVEKASREYKVPIMIDATTVTTADDAYFHSYARKDNSATVCRECDVVILRDAVLTKASSSDPKDIHEVRNLTIYPGGTLIIPSGVDHNFTVKNVQFRVEGEIVPHAKLSGTLFSTDQQVTVSRRINNSDAYFFSLPYDCNLADVRWSNGEPAVLGEGWKLQEYDAAARCNEGSTAGVPGHWKDITGSTIETKKGYQIMVNSKSLKELIFPMNIGTNNVSDAENIKIDNTDEVDIVKNEGSATKNNWNWNFIAEPYLCAMHPMSGDKITAGWLLYHEGTTEDPGYWTYENAGTAYFTVYNPSSKTYDQKLFNTLTQLDPFVAYFVQGKAVGKFKFTQSERILAPRRMPSDEELGQDESIFVGVTLSGNGQSDETHLRLRPDFTNEYQPGYDLQKFTTYYTERPQIYMKTPDYQLAFQAVSDSVAKSTWLPMGVYIRDAGTYTFALDANCPTDEVEAVYLYDATTGATTNLLYDTYSVATSKQLYTNKRFSLNVILNRKQPQVPTGVDLTDAPENMVRKLLIDGHVYIQRGNALYDVTGKQMLNR